MSSDEILQQIQSLGLTRDQAALYEALLKYGPLSAREATHEARVNRTLGYVVLEQLIEIGLVTKNKEVGSKTLYIPVHPSVLEERVESQRRAAERAQINLQTILPGLSSMYNLATGRPGVQFFEGLAGIKQVLDDSLTSKTDIYSFVDIAAVERYIPDLSREFAKSRRRLGLKKRNISIDTPENRAEIEGYYTDVTEERLLPSLEQSFGTVMQIYDGRISYFTLGLEHPIGVIIADNNIYQMHKILFEMLWTSPNAFKVLEK